MINKQTFFQNIRESLFAGKLTNGQVKGMEALIDMAGEMIPAQLAYVLATAYHETDKTMQPIEEYGKGKNRTYGHKVKFSGKPYTTPDKLYYGRGHTQNTWYENYEKLTKANTHGWDFLNQPQLLLEMIPSAWATIHAMKTGLYTGKKLNDYINATKCDFIWARSIINGRRKGETLPDRAEDIAGYAQKFLEAMK